MAVIAKWLGHADASITARIYDHSQDEALRAAGATLGQIVTTTRVSDEFSVKTPIHQTAGKRRFDKCARRDSNPQPSDP
jgi:hypothetical protein